MMYLFFSENCRSRKNDQAQSSTYVSRRKLHDFTDKSGKHGKDRESSGFHGESGDTTGRIGKFLESTGKVGKSWETSGFQSKDRV